jgi:hypothetical protein
MISAVSANKHNQRYAVSVAASAEVSTSSQPIVDVERQGPWHRFHCRLWPILFWSCHCCHGFPHHSRGDGKLKLVTS